MSLPDRVLFVILTRSGVRSGSHAQMLDMACVIPIQFITFRLIDKYSASPRMNYGTGREFLVHPRYI